jgi:hypothetical protein
LGLKPIDILTLLIVRKLRLFAFTSLKHLFRYFRRFFLFFLKHLYVYLI